MSEKKGNKRHKARELTPKLSKDELLRRLKVRNLSLPYTYVESAIIVLNFADFLSKDRQVGVFGD